MKRVYLFAILIVVSASVIGALSLNGFLGRMKAIDSEFSYERAWREADSLKDEGLPREAMEVVDRILVHARAAKEQPNWVKALLYKEALRSNFEERHVIESITAFNKELKILPEPASQIIRSALGELYLSYFRANQYEISQRTAFGKPGDVPEKWSLAQMSKLIDSSYTASLSNSELLSSEKMEKWAPAFKNVLSVKGPSYTLFDVLAGRALMFYASGESSALEMPAENRPGTPFLFSGARTFALSRIGYHEGSPSFLKALSIYRELLAAHLNDKQPDILIDIDLHRLNWARDWGSVPAADSLYRESVKAIFSAFKNSPAGMSAGYEVASSLYQQGIIEPSAKLKNSLFAESSSIATEVIQLFPESRGAAECRQLLHELKLPELYLQTSETYLPGDPITFEVRRKNCETLNFRLVSISKEDLKKVYFNVRNEESLDYSSLKPIREWNAPLPSETPMVSTLQHVTTEELPLGAYLLLASPSSDFDANGAPVAVSLFQVTQLSWFVEADASTEDFLVVVNRRSGKSESGVNVTFEKFEYANYGKVDPFRKAIDDRVSDKNGFVSLVGTDYNHYNTLYVALKKDSDYFLGRRTFYISKRLSGGDSEAKIKDIFFTDRAIYRPGQKVFFKGISYQEKDYKYATLSDHSVKVSFFDANGRLVESQDFITNKFGSFSGSFTIPQNLMSGYYEISSPDGSNRIKVEEYKRPSFAVTLLPYMGVSKPGEEVEIKGKAEAFSGFPIAGGKVTYTVKRKIWMPFFRFIVQDQDMELVHGETVTDQEGNFSIRFIASPDKRVSSSDNLTYYFSLDADVVDQSGETQSDQYTLAVSKQNLLIEVDIPSKVIINKKDPINVKVTNLVGKSVPANFTAEVYRIIQPDSSYWNLNLNQASYPYYRAPEGDLDELYLWKEGAYVSSLSLITTKDSLLYLNKLIKQPGAYVIKLKASDGAGNSIVRESRFIAYNENSALLPARLPFWFVGLSDDIKPNEPISFLIGSSERKANVLLKVFRNDSLVDNRWLVIDNKQEKMILPLPSREGDKFVITLAMVRNNYFFDANLRASVKEFRNTLDVKFSTFRSLLIPGNNEAWQVKVKRRDGVELPSELLVGMYDASLDQFENHSWDLYLNSRNTKSRNWSNGAFISGWSTQRFIDTVSIESPIMNLHPSLNWFDYQFYGTFGLYGNDKMLIMRENATVETGSAPGIYKARSTSANDGIMEIGITSQTDVAPQAPANHQNGNGKQMNSMRSNLQETAFFIPQLQTNEKGEAEFSFTVPGSLTSWHVMAFAHTKDLAVGGTDLYVKTQRQLMVMPQLPRYLRGGDTIAIPVRVVNLFDKPIKAEASFVLLDLVTGKKLDWSPVDSTKVLMINAGATSIASWNVIVPENPGMIVYRATVSSETHSDGEENILPVLSGKKWFVSSQNRHVKGQTLWQPDLSAGVDWKEGQNATLTVEYIENPAWFIVQALPQIRSRDDKGLNLALNNYYAANMGLMLMKDQPAIMKVVRSWSSNEANISPLLKNEDVKILMNNQTPWVQDAIDESNDYKKITTFFDEEQLKISSEDAFKRMKELQLPSGGFSWYDGMADSKFLTEEVLQTLGRMKKMSGIDPKLQPTLEKMVTSAISYLDDRMIENWKLDSIHKVKSSTIDADELKYMYARSFWLKDYSMPSRSAKIYKEMLIKLQKSVLRSDPAMQATSAVIFSRSCDLVTARKIIKSLKSKSLTNADGSIYWRKNLGYLWFEDPLKTQVLALEAIVEVENDVVLTEKVRSWLLAQRQTHSWETRSGNSDATYAFLLNGSSVTELGNPAEIILEGRKLESSVPSMAGSGWFKAELHPSSMDQLKKWRLEIRGNGSGTGWASIWTKYKGEQSHAVSSESGIKVEKAIFLLSGNSSSVVTPLKKNTPLKQGDRLRVQLTITTDRDMEFVALTDQRAAGLEPASRSGYLWRGGRGYYQEVKDEATNFFFDRLEKGVRTIEYEVIVAHSGNFSNGPAEIQSLYAPAFSGRSTGDRIEVQIR
ncbi:MAG: MG2 domain-containing protein [Sphingobacteriia bacterium]|nr:MG2 domain-containing protein [Sphingobacteriia bacterium]